MGFGLVFPCTGSVVFRTGLIFRKYSSVLAHIFVASLHPFLKHLLIIIIISIIICLGLFLCHPWKYVWAGVLVKGVINNLAVWGLSWAWYIFVFRGSID